MMLFSSFRSSLCQVKRLVQLSSVNFTDEIVNRVVVKILDSEGKPYHPEPDIPSHANPGKVIEPMDRKRFQRKAYATYLKQLSMKDLKSCHFDNRYTYIIANHHHPDFVRAKLIIRGITPEKKSLISLEGKNLIREAFQSGLKLDKLFFTRESLLMGITELESLLVAASLGEYNDHGPVLVKITSNMMNQLSQVQTPPGLIAIFRRPVINQETSASKACGIPVTVIGDNIRDPGNMGTLIRSSAAVGAERIICTKGCANPWESKVVRSGAGAHFRVNLISDFEWSSLPELLPPKDSAIVFAEKANFQPDEFKSAKTIKNLNYFDIDYSDFLSSDKKLAVVIGGEIEGISDEALALAYMYRESYKVNIPILKGIDSLNSAIAGSIILFEIQRQIIKSLMKQ